MTDRMLLILRAVRYKEAGLMVGFPALGGFAALSALSAPVILHYLLILTAFFLLSLAVYSFNAWGGRFLDAQNVMHRDHPLHRGETSHQTVLLSSVALLAASLGIFAVQSLIAAVLALLLWLLWMLYSHPTIQGKGKPVIGSLIHLVAGYLMFLVPYGLLHTVDLRGWLLASFFSWAFVGGHLNHEVMDYDADIQEGLRTNAILFGQRRMHNVSLGIFAVNYGFLAIATFAGIIEPAMAAPFLLIAPIHAALHRTTWRAALEPMIVKQYRDRYRSCFLLASIVAVIVRLGVLWR